MSHLCLSITFNIIIIVTIMEVFTGKEPCQSYWYDLCVIKMEFYSSGPLWSAPLYSRLRICALSLMEWACTSTQFGSICSSLVILFMFKERQWAFWHFNNVMLPIYCPWPGWKMPTPEWIAKCQGELSHSPTHPLPHRSQNNTHVCTLRVLLLFVPSILFSTGGYRGGVIN